MTSKARIYSGNLEYSVLMPRPGRWVKAEDYEKLEAEIELLKAELDTHTQDTAEIARLREYEWMYKELQK
jgi:hypothetical protein